jgi:hypothetical protein
VVTDVLGADVLFAPAHLGNAELWQSEQARLTRARLALDQLARATQQAVAANLPNGPAYLTLLLEAVMEGQALGFGTDEPIDGADLVERVGEWWRRVVQALHEERELLRCSVCHGWTPARTAHLHQDDWIGEECWDERLRSSE